MSEEKLNVLEIVKQLMAIWPAGGEAPQAADLLADLPAEAIMGPKRGRDGNVLTTADANMTGYKPAFIVRAAIDACLVALHACHDGDPEAGRLYREGVEAVRIAWEAEAKMHHAEARDRRQG